MRRSAVSSTPFGPLDARTSRVQRDTMQVLASPEAVAYVRERGGSLFVWVEPLDTQGRVSYLDASTESPGADRSFTRLTGGDFDLFLDTGGLSLPERIELELRGWRRKRLRASWNGATFPSNPRRFERGEPHGA